MLFMPRSLLQVCFFLNTRNLKYLLLLILASSRCLRARSAERYGVGTVTDPSGGVVAGVTITITSAETAQ